MSAGSGRGHRGREAIESPRLPFTSSTMGSTVSPPPRPMTTPSSAELPIQEATLDLIRWFLPILHRLPRQHRHGLGERLITNLYELLEQLALARYLRSVAGSGALIRTTLVEFDAGEFVVLRLQQHLKAAAHVFQI